MCIEYNEFQHSILIQKISSDGKGFIFIFRSIVIFSSLIILFISLLIFNIFSIVLCGVAFLGLFIQFQVNVYYQKIIACLTNRKYSIERRKCIEIKKERNKSNDKSWYYNYYIRLDGYDTFFPIETNQAESLNPGDACDIITFYDKEGKVLNFYKGFLKSNLLNGYVIKSIIEIPTI